MDAEAVRALAAAGELWDVEFKQDGRDRLNDRQLVEAVVCVANGPGGTVLVGVDDGGHIVGAQPRHGDITDPARVEALILNKTDPHLAVRAEVVEVDGNDVLVVQVPRGPHGPVGTTDGVFKRRSLRYDGKPECVAYRPSEMLSAGLSLAGVDYGGVPARGATLADLDPGELERFRRLCDRGSGDSSLSTLDDTSLLRALRLLAEEDGQATPTLAAVLLFGREASLARWAGSAECLFQDVREGPTMANETLRLPLLRLMTELEERIRIRNSETELMVGLQRVDIPLVSTSTVREALANALVHRDYTELGPVTVQFADDYLSVTSPGGLVPGVTIENILEQSRPRSVVLADAFKRAGLVDRKGKGVNDMFASQLRAGRDAPDYSRSTARSVSLLIPIGRADLDLVRFILTYEHDAQRPLRMDDLRVVHQIRVVGPSSSRELAEDLNLVDSAVRGTCTRLIELGLLDVTGAGRNRRYTLSSQFYALAEDRNAYVRVRGMQPVQQEQMILEYVRRFGSITRSQAGSLCQIEPTQASRMLRGMTSRSLLAMEGHKRSARYVLPE